MKKLFYSSGLLLFMLLFVHPVAVRAQIVADHTVVDKYDQIPQQYIDEVKKMWVIVAGESHSFGYRKGCLILESLDPRFKVKVRGGGEPDGYTEDYMRISSATWGDLNNASGWIYSYGEEDWFTNATAISRTKAHLTYCNTNNLAIAAMGFGWCWDMTSENWPAGDPDPVYKVRWAGRTYSGPQGNKRWGLDADDFALTGNSVSMDTYLNATAEYEAYCSDNGYPTKMFYTTGPVDGNENLNENGYQRYIKHEYIRNFVNADPGRYLFDYADILCWNDAGERHEVTWKDYGGVTQTFQAIHPDNMIDMDGGYVEDGDHIGERGALRLAKAMWWMLARMAGWDGEPLSVDEVHTPVTPAVNVYPVPATDRINIRIAEPAGEVTTELFDARGNRVRGQTTGDADTTLDLNDLPSGVYFLRITGKGKTEYRKIVRM